MPSSVVLSPEDILSHEEVGLGASAVVYRAWHKEKEVAVKQYILRRTAKKVYIPLPPFSRLELMLRC